VLGDREIEGLTATDVWRYYCLHMDWVHIIAWIDAQYSAKTDSVPRWPLTEPISPDMIAQLHQCRARLADHLLDHLARSVSGVLYVFVLHNSSVPC